MKFQVVAVPEFAPFVCCIDNDDTKIRVNAATGLRAVRRVGRNLALKDAGLSLIATSMATSGAPGVNPVFVCGDPRRDWMRGHVFPI